MKHSWLACLRSIAYIEYSTSSSTPTNFCLADVRLISPSPHLNGIELLTEHVSECLQPVTFSLSISTISLLSVKTSTLQIIWPFRLFRLLELRRLGFFSFSGLFSQPVNHEQT